MDTLNFENSENVLRYFQERSDDIDKVVIPQTPHVSVAGKVHRGVGMVVHFFGNNGALISRTDAECVLNDGILNRMKIRIELGAEGMPA